MFFRPLFFFGIRKPKEKQQPHSQIVKEVKAQQNKTADVNNTLSGTDSSLSEDKPKKLKVYKDDLEYYMEELHLPREAFELRSAIEEEERRKIKEELLDDLQKNGFAKSKFFECY